MEVKNKNKKTNRMYIYYGEIKSKFDIGSLFLSKFNID